MTKCGLSPESALKASKTVRLKNTDNPDLILSYFENFGFSKSHISQMVAKFPTFLTFNLQKTISPKVEFFLSKGASTPELINIFAVNPQILRRNLENQLVYSFELLVESLQSEDKAIVLIKQNPWILHNTPEKSWLPNINSLRENGVPTSNILRVMRNDWKCLVSNQVDFRMKVQNVKEMGFDPLEIKFVIAVKVLVIMKKSIRDRKVEVFKSWGWSDEDFTKAFRKHPLCLSCSEDKIMAAMSFYVNQLGLDSSVIANCPLLLGYSLTKRLIPRGAVIQFLLSKGILKLDSRVPNMFICSEKRFLEKYVNCHEEAPLLTKLYNDKLHEATSEEKRKL